MNTPDFLRHSGRFPQENMTDTINLIGCGAVGSNVAMLAARMGWTKFRVWDFDRVERHNLPNQAFLPEHVDMHKVDALEQLLKAFNPLITVEKYCVPFTSEEHKNILIGPLIIATDSMATRADITKAFAYNLNIPRVLEARLGFDYGELHVIDPMDSTHIQAWRASLKSDAEVPEGPCNQRICTTLVVTISSVLVHYLCVPYALQRDTQQAWQFPFKTRFMLQDTLKTATVKYQVEDLKENI